MLLGFWLVVVILIHAVSSDVVPPPANVKVNCANRKTTVSWDYRRERPQTTFRVNIKGPKLDEMVITADQLYDLTHSVWQSGQHYLNYLVVTVTAVQGGNESEAVSSESFSFNDLKTVDKKCVLQFPPWDVDEDKKRKGVTVSFENPIHFYKELKKDAEDLEFHFSIITNQMQQNVSCTRSQITCKGDVKFPEGVKKCVRLKGHFTTNGVPQVMFQETPKNCTPENNLVVLTVVPLFVLGLAIIGIVILICLVKAWTMDIPNPKFLDIDDKCQDPEKRILYPEAQNGQISSLQVHKNCQQTFEDDSASSVTDSRASLLYAERGNLCPDGGYRSGIESSNESVNAACEEEDNQSVSPYDRPHVMQMDLGDGDMVDVYRR
ncbi:uncharacterized protein ACNS7B_000533 [Menidia menidia]